MSSFKLLADCQPSIPSMSPKMTSGKESSMSVAWSTVVWTCEHSARSQHLASTVLNVSFSLVNNAGILGRQLRIHEMRSDGSPTFPSVAGLTMLFQQLSAMASYYRCQPDGTISGSVWLAMSSGFFEPMLMSLFSCRHEAYLTPHAQVQPCA